MSGVILAAVTPICRLGNRGTQWLNLHRLIQPVGRPWFQTADSRTPELPFWTAKLYCLYINCIITKITHFSPLKCLEKYHDEIPHPAAEEQPTTFIFGNKELFCPIHRFVEQLHNMAYLCRLHFFHDSFSYSHLVSFSFNLKHIWCRFTGTITLYFGFKSCRPHLQVHEQIAICNYPILYRLNFSFLLGRKI